jgi:hypothetical protein
MVHIVECKLNKREELESGWKKAAVAQSNIRMDGLKKTKIFLR